jgi:hypothetical protein
MIRIVHFVVVIALIAAAAHVYKIKFDSTVQAERVAKLRIEIKRERDAIASLRAEWSKLDTPARIQQLAERHLSLKPVDPMQFDSLDRLPERPPQIVPPDTSDPIAAIIENIDGEAPTGSTSDQSERAE